MDAVPQQEAHGRGIGSQLTIKGLDRRDEGEYACTASNTHGHDSRAFTLLVLGEQFSFWQK